MTSSDNSVIIVGAGPGGLCLAGEFALAGVRCTVLERRAGHSAESRALGLQPRTLELLQLRNLGQKFTLRGHPLDHFRLTVGATRLDLHRLGTGFQQLSIVPQSKTEQLLEARALELGARVVREARVVGLWQDEDGVTVSVRGPAGAWKERAAWVVGCDGAHSTVRDSLGIGFPGKTYPYNVIAGDVRLAKPPKDGMLIEVGRSGLVVAIDFGTGWWRMGIVNWDSPKDTGDPIPSAEFDTALSTIFGYDLGPHDPVWMTRFRFQRRQATEYRRGRVFLLGDAAHVHAPLGAQGLNLSIQDAMNLGWKLAAVVRGDAPSASLDSYERERRPIANRVLTATDAAIRVLMSQRLPIRLGRRLVIPTVVRTPRGHQTIAGYVSGLAWSYPPTAAGRRHTGLLGQRIPDVDLRGEDGEVRSLFDLFHTAQFVLIDQSGGRLHDAAAPWSDRIVRVRAQIENRPTLASYPGILCRPDGYCAWAGGCDDGLALRAVLRQWCGNPSAQLRDKAVAETPDGARGAYGTPTARLNRHGQSVTGRQRGAS